MWFTDRFWSLFVEGGVHPSHLVVHNTACELFGPTCEPMGLNVNLLVVDESYFGSASESFGRACESLFVGLLETLHCTVYNLKN